MTKELSAYAANFWMAKLGCVAELSTMLDGIYAWRIARGSNAANAVGAAGQCAVRNLGKVAAHRTEILVRPRSLREIAYDSFRCVG